MSTILNKIAEYKREEVSAAKSLKSLTSVRQDAESLSKPRGFVSSLQAKVGAGLLALIAEIKKASPSKGLIRADFHPSSLAEAYFEGGAACLSVLTDSPSFQGHPNYLKEAREAVPLPCLRKDFLLDPYQVYEARSWGADCILLIMAMLDDALAADLMTLAHDLSMDVLVEVHDGYELERAQYMDAQFIGINNRNLHTFDVTLDTTRLLMPHLDPSRFVVSESGLFTHSDLTSLAELGVKGFLVGEALMRQDDVCQATKSLLFGNVENENRT